VIGLTKVRARSYVDPVGARTERLRDAGHRAERATAILDVAAELLLRHGYRRVTIDDVAAGANVGKGTIYLHWKTREQLFSAVFEREMLCAIDEVRQALRQDPQVCLLHRFARSYFVAIAHQPLLRGFLLADAELLGNLSASRDPSRDDRHNETFRVFLELLAEHRLLREDMDIDEIGYAYQATFEGFLRQEAVAPVDGLDQRADLLARTVERAFESDRALPSTELRDVAATAIALLTDIIDADRPESGLHRNPS
jgi:AcrR family transcriptional regulator